MSALTLQKKSRKGTRQPSFAWQSSCSVLFWRSPSVWSCQKQVYLEVTKDSQWLRTTALHNPFHVWIIPLCLCYPVFFHRLSHCVIPLLLFAGWLIGSVHGLWQSPIHKLKYNPRTHHQPTIIYHLYHHINYIPTILLIKCGFIHQQGLSSKKPRLAKPQKPSLICSSVKKACSDWSTLPSSTCAP